MSKSFAIGDYVRVSRSMMPDYIGIEGTVVSILREDDPIYTTYNIRTNDGRDFEFLEYQLDLVTRAGDSSDTESQP